MMETLAVEGWRTRHLEPSRCPLSWCNHRGPLKSLNVKQSSEIWVCILYITRNCVMPFNPHEYELFQTEHILSGSGVKGWGGILQLTILVKQSEINHCGGLIIT